MKTIIEMYLDWLNNFITLKGFAEHYGLEYDDAVTIVNLGRKYNQIKSGL